MTTGREQVKLFDGFSGETDYTKINNLVKLVVDNMPLEGTWFYVNSGMTSDVIFPDFNISKDQATAMEKDFPTLSSSKDSELAADEYKDSLLDIPGDLEVLLKNAKVGSNLDRVLDLPGSAFDGADIKTVSVDIPIGTFASFGAADDDDDQKWFSVSNDKTRALRLKEGDLVTEFVDANYKNNPVIMKAFDSTSNPLEWPGGEGKKKKNKGVLNIPKLEEVLPSGSKKENTTKAFSGEQNPGLKARGAQQADYYVTLNLPVVMDEAGKAAKLYYRNAVKTKGFPSGSYSFKTDDGYDQQIGYKQSYDLADYYVAYAKGGSSELAFKAIEYAPSDDQASDYNGLTENPITARKAYDNLSDEQKDQQDTPSSIDVQSGLKDLVLRAYGDIAYQLSAEEQSEIAEAETNLVADLTDLANDIKKSYLSNPAFKNDPLFAGEGEGDAQFQYRAVASSLFQMATIIYYNHTQLVNPTTYTYKQISENYAAAEEIEDQAQRESKHQEGIGELYGQLSRAQLDWQGTIYSNFGTITPDNVLRIPPHTLPWDAKFYQQYKQVRLKGNYDTFFNKTDVAAYFQGSLQDAVRYLIDLNTLNKDNRYTFNTPDKFVYMVGDSDVPYGPKVNTFPRPASPENNSISIEIKSASEQSEESSSTESTSVAYSAEVSASNWWYSASASTQGKYENSNSMSEAATNASSQDITISYTNMGQQPISLGSNWFKPDILAEAWSKKTTRNDPKYEGGFGFYSPTIQHKYITAELYYVSNYAFGDQVMSIDLKNEKSTQKSTEHFDSYSQTTSVAASVGWGPFRASTESSVSTSNENRSSSFDAQSTSTGMQINAQPLKAYQTDEIRSANGEPKMLVAVEVTEIATHDFSHQNSSSKSSERALPRAIHSSASFRTKKPSRDEYIEGETYGSGKGEFTIASPVDYLSDERNRYHLKGGDDHHFGGYGHDFVSGGNGDDRLIGLAGNDNLKGGKGDDILYGGEGKNRLFGGDGEDHFMIERLNTRRGTLHKILDATSDDVLVFSGYHPRDIEVRKNGRIAVDGRVIAILKGAEEELINLLVSEAIFN